MCLRKAAIMSLFWLNVNNLCNFERKRKGGMIMTVIKKAKAPKKNEIEEDVTRFKKYDKSPYFIEKNRRAAELIKKSPIPDWMRK